MPSSTMPAPPRPARPNSTPSYFSQFDGFQARDNTSFDNEFERLACSQGWEPGSQQFRKQRTRAAVAEVERHYFAPVAASPVIKEEDEEESDEEDLYLTALDEGSEEQEQDATETEPKKEEIDSTLIVSTTDLGTNEDEVKHEERQSSYASPSLRDDDTCEAIDFITQRAEPASQDRYVRNLQGYQRLCLEVRAPMHDTIAECKEALSKTFVNIEDLIDARRIGTEVRVWENLDSLAEYTVREKKVFSREDAKGTYIESLLQKLPSRFMNRLRSARKAMIKKHKALKANNANSKVEYRKVNSGRVNKPGSAENKMAQRIIYNVHDVITI